MTGQINIRMVGMRSSVRYNVSGAFVPPNGFVFLVDTDGAYLVDTDGAYLVEAI